MPINYVCTAGYAYICLLHYDICSKVFFYLLCYNNITGVCQHDWAYCLGQCILPVSVPCNRGFGEKTFAQEGLGSASLAKRKNFNQLGNSNQDSFTCS